MIEMLQKNLSNDIKLTFLAKSFLNQKKRGYPMQERISGSTTLTCLLGHPVGHSISPKMHNTAFAHLGLDYAYLAFDILPEQLKDTVNGLRLLQCKGFNLTMPLKTAIIPYLDDISLAAKLSNSVNTVVNDNGRLIGHTTDGIGFMDAAQDAGFSMAKKDITILGAGGAATSICTQAALDGVNKITMLKRKNASFEQTVAFAQKVSEETGCEIIVRDFLDEGEVTAALSSCDFLINATNVGMGDDKKSPLPKNSIPSGIVVSDIIYHPVETTLLKDAKERGCQTFSGAFMLLFQGAAAFELWCHQKMPIELIKQTCFQNITIGGK